MDETKAQVFNRLNKRADWPTIEAAKNDRIKELRAGGLKRDEASIQAWRELSEQYPPLSFDSADDQPADIDAAQSADPPSFDSDAEFIQGARWVYANLSRKPRQSDAPDDGAWALLQWAREFPNDFFKTIMPMIAKSAGSKDAEAEEELADCEGVETMLVGMGRGEGFSSLGETA